MKRLRHAIAAATLTMLARRSMGRLQARVRGPSIDGTRDLLLDRLHGVVPTTLLESPALVALASRALPPPPSRDRRRFLSGVVLAVLVAAAATMLAFTIVAIVRARRTSRGRAATTPTAQPLVIPIDAARAGDLGPKAAAGVDVPTEAGNQLEA